VDYRKLGLGPTVSAVAYGTWITHAGQIGDDQALACVAAALDEGVTTFDTADFYAAGEAERVLGRALRGEPRDAVFVATKVGKPMGPGPDDQGLGRAHVVKGCEDSLRRLGLDYIDLFQAHVPDPTVPVAETIGALASLVAAGKTRFIGVCNWDAALIAEAHALAADLGVPLVSSQTQYSMLCRDIEALTLPVCERLGIGQLVWSPAAQGVLSGKYLPGRPPPAGSRAGYEGRPWFLGFFLQDAVLGLVQRLRPWAAEAGLTMTQLAIAWVLRRPEVSGAIIGASRPEQVRENARAAGARLDGGVLAGVEEVLASVSVAPSI
jgi:aryl-alcohol dehydrogenase-like predicted oxidoreductase